MTNEQELADFMAGVQHKRERLDYYQWRCYLFPDYSETESVIVYKVHHSLADGVATIMMLINVTDDPQMKDIPPLMMRFNPLL